MNNQNLIETDYFDVKYTTETTETTTETGGETTETTTETIGKTTETTDNTTETATETWRCTTETIIDILRQFAFSNRIKKLRGVSQRLLVNLNLNYEKIYLFCLHYKGATYFLIIKIN